MAVSAIAELDGIIAALAAPGFLGARERHHLAGRLLACRAQLEAERPRSDVPGGSKPEDLPELLRAEDLARLSRSRLKANTWRMWMRTGRIPSVNLGRRVFVRRADYEQFLAAHRRNGGGLSD